MIKYETICNNKLNNEDLINHLCEINYLKWLQKDNDWLPNLYIIVAKTDNRVVGHISLLKNPLKLLNEGAKQITVNNKPLWEMYVQTFYVNSSYRKQGIGHHLQIKALEYTKIKECYQLRSWSSQDKIANYAVKFNLGFLFVPATITTQNGEKIAGGYFVKSV